MRIEILVKLFGPHYLYMELFGISFDLGVSAVKKLPRARTPYMESSRTSGLRAAVEDVNALKATGKGT